jgi:putative spermidine/putrescine transport system ATP-binding protein
VVAVDHVELTIGEGEFFGLLGPSGSGKTTVLRMIAGFEQPTRGAVLLDGSDVTKSPPYERDVNTVFQDYALFPHLDVRENVEYGLKVKRVPRRERRRRAAEALETVRLGDLGNRKPGELSGGQRQRVALARALVNRPKVLLLDEPLGALDLKLREEMQVELKAIQDEVGITFIFVTHDQGEALSMSDRVAVFNAGRVNQVGTPHEIYERPANAFVAGFVGTSNLVSGVLARDLMGRDGDFVIRPERLELALGDADLSAGLVQLSGHVRDIQYYGSGQRVIVALPSGAELIASGGLADSSDLRPGDRVMVGWHPRDAFALTSASTTVSANTGGDPT